MSPGRTALRRRCIGPVFSAYGLALRSACSVPLFLRPPARPPAWLSIRRGLSEFIVGKKREKTLCHSDYLPSPMLNGFHRGAEERLKRPPPRHALKAGFGPAGPALSPDDTPITRSRLPSAAALLNTAQNKAARPKKRESKPEGEIPWSASGSSNIRPACPPISM